MDNSHMLVKYDARLRDNAAHGVVQEVTDTVQVGLGHARNWGGGGCGMGVGPVAVVDGRQGETGRGAT